jgi:hypothetical protein
MQCKQAAEMGYDGKTLIHPAQIEPANRVFAPTPGQLELSKVGCLEPFQPMRARTHMQEIVIIHTNTLFVYIYIYIYIYNIVSLIHTHICRKSSTHMPKRSKREAMWSWCKASSWRICTWRTQSESFRYAFTICMHVFLVKGTLIKNLYAQYAKHIAEVCTCACRANRSSMCSHSVRPKICVECRSVA